MAEFHGAKVALFLGRDLLVYQRDDTPGLAFRGAWDFPGGGREGAETPVQTALRETEEEFSLVLKPSDFVWQREYRRVEGDVVWFLVTHQPQALAAEIVFGDEGQSWDIWPVARFLQHSGAVPNLQERLKDYLDDIGGESCLPDPG